MQVSHHESAGGIPAERNANIPAERNANIPAAIAAVAAAGLEPLRVPPAAPSAPFPFNPCALSRERRRAVCVHEAAHAVIYALGGAWVYRVAVAPEGSAEWRTAGRKGAELADLLGVCCPSDSPATMFIRWDAEECAATADRRRFAELLAMMEEHCRGYKREQWRQVRAHVCAMLAGPAAEQLHERPDEEPYLWEGDCGEFDDITKAEAHCWLLPWRGEFAHLAALTIETLRRPDVWALVLAVADRLEAVVDLEEELMPLLPTAAPDWPPSPRAKVRRPAEVKARAAV